jgi:hypothetical protein
VNSGARTPQRRAAGLAQNSSGTAKAPRGRPFRPGESGNPGGRPKSNLELVESSRALTPMALQVWEKAMADYLAGRGEAPQALKAAGDSMARAWGRTQERLEVRADVTSMDASAEEQLIATIKRLAGEDDEGGRGS